MSATTASDSMVADLLRRVHVDLHDEPFHVFRDGPGIVAELTGAKKPHESYLWRCAKKGSHGVKLRTISAPDGLRSTRRWCAQFLVKRDEAKRAAESRPAPARRSSRALQKHAARARTDAQAAVTNNKGAAVVNGGAP